MFALKKPVLLLALLVLTGTAVADPVIQDTPQPEQPGLLSRYASSAQSAVSGTSSSIQSLLDSGLSYLGIRYRFGGNGPETGGFDCSGLVKRVFGDAIGLNLPRTAADMSKLGQKIDRDELKPGDLVFFNTIRSFSHVGIYLGGDQFLHAPRTGARVRVEELGKNYWQKRFAGARRLVPDAHASELGTSPVVMPSQLPRSATVDVTADETPRISRVLQPPQF